MKTRNLKLGLLLMVLMEAAAADPVVLDITFANSFQSDDTAFGIWESALLPSDDVLLDPFNYDSAGLPTPAIPFQPVVVDPFFPPVTYGSLGSFTDIFAFGAFSQSATWDLAAGLYTFVLYDLFGDGLGFGGDFSLAVNGLNVGGGNGAFYDPFVNPFPFDFGGIAKIEFEITAATVPEPGMLSLFGLGIFALALARRRRH